MFFDCIVLSTPFVVIFFCAISLAPVQVAFVVDEMNLYSVHGVIIGFDKRIVRVEN